MKKVISLVITFLWLEILFRSFQTVVTRVVALFKRENVNDTETTNESVRSIEIKEKIESKVSRCSRCMKNWRQDDVQRIVVEKLGMKVKSRVGALTGWRETSLTQINPIRRIIVYH